MEERDRNSEKVAPPVSKYVDDERHFVRRIFYRFFDLELQSPDEKCTLVRTSSVSVVNVKSALAHLRKHIRNNSFKFFFKGTEIDLQSENEKLESVGVLEYRSSFAQHYVSF